MIDKRIVMTVAEAVACKREAEDNIARALRDFESATSMRIDDVQTTRTQAIGSRAELTVTLEVKL